MYIVQAGDRRTFASPLKKPESITPEEHCLSKQIDQVDLPGIASSGILHVQEYGY